MPNAMLDTFLNVGVFVFLGLLIYLYFLPMPEEHDAEAAPSTAREASPNDKA